MVIDLLPSLMVQVESVLGGGSVGRCGQRDVGGVHVSHDAAIGEGIVEAKQANDSQAEGGGDNKDQSGLESGFAHCKKGPNGT